jgi:hypothetical protein
MIEDELVHAFRKLDLQISSEYDPRQLNEQVVLKRYGRSTIELIPTTFLTLKEAKLFSDLGRRRAQHFVSCALIAPESSALSRPCTLGPPTDTFIATGTNMHFTINKVTDQIRLEQAIYAAEIEKWYRAVQPLFHRLQSTCGTRSRDAFVAAVVFEDEMPYDQFEPEFREAVKLIKLGRKEKHS